MAIKEKENHTVHLNTLTSDLESMINNLAPVKSSTEPSHSLSTWYTYDLQIIKKNNLRNLEKTMNKHQTAYNTMHYTTQRNYYDTRSKYFSGIL